MKNIDDSTETFLAVLAILLFIPSIILSGLVLTILWGWFITPTFGLPVPSIPVMLGLTLMLAYVTHDNANNYDPREKSEILGNGVARMISKPLLALVVGYIIHIFV